MYFEIVISTSTQYSFKWKTTWQKLKWIDDWRGLSVTFSSSVHQTHSIKPSKHQSSLCAAKTWWLHWHPIIPLIIICLIVSGHWNGHASQSSATALAAGEEAGKYGRMLKLWPAFGRGGGKRCQWAHLDASFPRCSSQVSHSIVLNLTSRDKLTP